MCSEQQARKRKQAKKLEPDGNVSSELKETVRNTMPKSNTLATISSFNNSSFFNN
jgi:hypothetical protein